MPKLIRIILHILQFGALLTGLGYALSYILINEGAWSGIRSATLDQPYGAIMFGILAVALSPSLWSSRREGQGTSLPNVGHMTGSYDAVPTPPTPAPQSGNVDPSSGPAAPVAPSGPQSAPQGAPQSGPRPPVMAPASGQVAQPSAPPQAGAAVPPQQPPGGAVPQAGTGYPTDTNPGMAQSQFAPRPGEPGGPPATDNSPPNSGTLQNPKSPWS